MQVETSKSVAKPIIGIVLNNFENATLNRMNNYEVISDLISNSIFSEDKKLAFFCRGGWFTPPPPVPE